LTPRFLETHSNNQEEKQGKKNHSITIIVNGTWSEGGRDKLVF